MRVIIPCAGGSNRWGDFGGVPKHLVKLCGEPVLHRAVRLTNEVAPDAGVKVVVRDMTDRRYIVDGSTRSKAKLNPDAGDVDKVLSSAHQWHANGRTVVAWGDVWWSREALGSVLSDPIDGWHAWLRILGDGGEIFAFAFDPDAHDMIRSACERVAEAHRAGQMHGIPGGWALYRVLCGRDVTDHGDWGHASHVNDWTEDMDTPEDWHRWCARYARASRRKRKEMTR